MARMEQELASLRASVDSFKKNKGQQLLNYPQQKQNKIESKLQQEVRILELKRTKKQLLVDLAY